MVYLFLLQNCRIMKFLFHVHGMRKNSVLVKLVRYLHQSMFFICSYGDRWNGFSLNRLNGFFGKVWLPENPSGHSFACNKEIYYKVLNNIVKKNINVLVLTVCYQRVF